MDSYQHLFILDESGEPKHVEDVLEWGRWFEAHQHERIIRQDKIGEVFVSTVFLGVNHNFYSNAPPILWETMIFGGQKAEWQRRYSTKVAAILGHEEALKLIGAGDLVDE